MLGSENWEDDFDALLHLVGSKTLYGYDSYLGQLQRQSSAGGRGPVAGVGDRVGKLDESGVSREGHVVHAGVSYVCNVCGSAHSCDAWSMALLGMHLCNDWCRNPFARFSQFSHSYQALTQPPL